ncbi:neuronal acetylcholine receptor subunit beta-4 [Eurosta solidaginis]|uniref:neuronal acetylcholine receptor subunit beta-4 n=1 Tax=Eurosta solidaginis TaxID=178769 RepID=UPI00353111A4
MNLPSLYNSSALVLFLTVIFTVQTVAKKYNVTLAQMDNCKELYLHSNSGYAYRQFFHIHKMANNKFDANERLHLKFYVLADMDAHILLATNDKPRSKDRVYEVVIGAGQNSFSTIRMHMGSQRISTNQDPNILSFLDPTPIEIIQTKDGIISVYITGYKKEPLLSYNDSEPLDINYLSFSSFGMAKAKWFYDCQFDDGFEEEMEEELHTLDPLHSLMANISKNAENESIPLNLESVNFAFQLKSVAYNHEKSILYTRLQLSLFWQDPRLEWNPYENGIGAISFTANDAPTGIWKPDIIVLNAAHRSHLLHEPEVSLVIYANGSISLLNTNAEFATWCVDTKRNWPHERLNCGLILGLESFSPITHEPITLEYDNARPLPVEPFNMLSEWHFRQISISVIANDNNDTERNSRRDAIARSMNGDLSLEFTIERNGVFYKNVFTMPLLACETLIVLSFLLRGYRRGGLILVVFLVISLGVMFVTKHAPTAYIPNTLHAYRYVMCMATFCYLLHVFLMWLELYPPETEPREWMMTLINVSTLRLILCMRITDCDEFVSIQTHPWRELAKMINNICFITVTILIGVIDILLLPKF